MTTAEIKRVLRKELGYPFTYRELIAKKMQYKSARQVDQYLYGLQKVGSRYFTDDVIEKIIEAIDYKRRTI